MELHRLIFRVDFRNAWSIFPHWGEVLSTLESSNFWKDPGEDVISRTIVASREDESKNKVHQLHVRVNDIDGIFEGHPIASPREFDEAFRPVDYILNLLQVEEYKRVGVRFYFLQPYESFETACELFSSQVRPEYWNLFDSKVSDISIVSVHNNEGQKFRFSAGPLRRDEYPTWFGAPREIKPENALLFDIDCSSNSYRPGKFDLRKLVALYYDKALNHADRVLKFIGTGR